MTHCRDTLIVKREAYFADNDNPDCERRDTRCEIRTTTDHLETLIIQSISFRNLDASRFTFHEQRGQMLAGC
jgi:hypothetical protein